MLADLLQYLDWTHLIVGFVFGFVLGRLSSWIT